MNVEIQDLLNSNFNLDILGFAPGELDTLLAESNETGEGESFDEIEDTLKAKNTCPKCGYEWN